MRRLRGIRAVAFVAAAACATPNFDDGSPPPLSDDTPKKHVTGASSSAAPSSSSASGDLPPAPSSSGDPFGDDGGPGNMVDAGPQAKRWKGTLSSTLPVDFGGGQECHYRITLMQVAVDITAAANGDIVAANVTALAVEQVLSSPCNNTAIPAHTHHYVLATPTLLPSGVSHLELAPLSTNHPLASLVIEADLRAAAPALTLQWHRTDFGPPLDWTVTAHLTAQPQ